MAGIPTKPLKIKQQYILRTNILSTRFECEDGKWRKGDGEWRNGDGEWKIEDGKWRIEDGKFVYDVIFNSPFSIIIPQR